MLFEDCILRHTPPIKRGGVGEMKKNAQRNQERERQRGNRVNVVS